ncbi:Acetylcholinesterase [Holothuria leucospilota]|uniref:Carboxylic ester hydrolase n=1 Tax=Holothuria leucospilota TaxID=206669 RepID=A0A9Q1BT37_HOLLE|nr:Acetylcholinesterase [Holothuria leucospilota]
MICLTYLVAFLSSIQITSGTVQPTVTLKDGTVLQGVYEEFNSDLLPVYGKIESYYGIPYAEAPVGPLRFKPPVPKKQLDSPLEATKVGRSCMQPDISILGVPLTNEEMSEDCLFLDVIVPKSVTENSHVLVSIHGGGFTMGAGQMSWFHFLTLASYGNIIVVAFNYRLGPFGFLTTAFGGDPNKVTIGGISAGGASAAFHTLSPGSKGLFQYAMIESGSPFDSWVTYRQGEEARLEVRTLAKLIGCRAEDIEDDAKLLNCLMKAPAEDINENIGKSVAEICVKKLKGEIKVLGPKFSVLNSEIQWENLQKVGLTGLPGPSVDGVFLPKNALNILEEGTLNGESYVVGSNAEEGTGYLSIFFPDKEVKPVINNTSLSAIISSGLIGDVPSSIVQKLMKTLYTIDEKDLLNENQEDYFHEISQFLGDLIFFCGSSKFAKLASQSKNVYRYTMTFVPSNNLMGVNWMGATHGCHAQFVFGMPFQEKFLEKFTDKDRDMSRKVMQYWINFMKTGNPNIATDADYLTLPNWPKFKKTDQVYKDLTPDMENRYMKERECYFMDNVFLPLRNAFKEFKKSKIADDEQSKWTEEGQCEGEACHVDEEKAEMTKERLLGIKVGDDRNDVKTLP